MAGEIVPLPDIAPVPWTKPWYRGLANVRGRLIGVVDLLQLTGREPLPAEQAQQILVFGEGLAVNAGILITRAFGIRNLKDLTALPPAGESAANWEQVRYRGNRRRRLHGTRSARASRVRLLSRRSASEARHDAMAHRSAHHTNKHHRGGLR